MERWLIGFMLVGLSQCEMHAPAMPTISPRYALVSGGNGTVWRMDTVTGSLQACSFSPGLVAPSCSNWAAP